MMSDYSDSADDGTTSVVREDAAGASTHSYLDLRVYRLAHDLGVAPHRLSSSLPKSEMYELGSQLRRASKSVSANIVEGHGRRRYKAEFIRFLIYAKASLQETEEHLRYVSDCYPSIEATAGLMEAADALSRRLARFIDGVERKHQV